MLKLVNKLAQLKGRLKKSSAKIEAEIQEVEEALVAYAEKNGVDVIVGKDQEARIRRETQHKFPGKNDEGRDELEALLKESGKWDEVSDLSAHRLRPVLREGAWSEDILVKVRKFERTAKRTSVTLRKRNPEK